MKINMRRLVNLLVGPGLFAAAILLLPASVFESDASRAAVGLVAWMAYWWVAAPVDYAVTAFLPIIVNAFLPMADMGKVIQNYSCETILLLLGASIITVSWEETGVDRRIAAFFLRKIGSGLKGQIVFWYLLTTALSAVLPNAVVCATVTPIAVAMLKFAGEGDVGKSPIASKLLLAIVYAAGVGGLATPLGGAMNLITVDYIQKLTGQEYMYVDWVVRLLPIMAVIIVSNLVFMLRDVKAGMEIGGSKEYFERESKAFPPMTFEEKAALAFFVIATMMAFTRQFYKELLPGLKPAYSFLLCAALSFLVTRRDGSRLMKWKMVQKKIVWELIYIFAGGLALGTLINASGAAAAIGKMVSGMGMQGGFLAVFVFVAVPLLISDVTSNTATAAVTIPIVISVMQGIGQNPIPFIYVASIGVNLSYMLPTSIRAIPVGYGLSPKYMLREGWKVTIMELILLPIAAWLLIRFW